MKALILSVSAGGGHKNAAEAIEEYTLMKEPDSKIYTIDTIKYISPFLDKLIIGTYLNSLKIYPNAFKVLFNTSDAVTPDDSLFALVSKLNEFVATKLIPLIEEIQPDIMVGTHPFSAFMLQILRKKYNNHTPNMVIITDYGSHSFWVHPDIDKYIVAHKGMVPELACQGREWESVLPLGIPVKPSFLGTFDRNETLRKIGLNPLKKTVTIMGGSLAIGNIKKILKKIDSINLDFQIVVVAANNNKLYEDAMKISLSSNKDISVLKYCNFMNALMQSSDILVTKPGGLTITEAMICGCPMAIFYAIPGQEVQNAKFLMKNNLAIDLDLGEDCDLQIKELLEDDEKLQALSLRSKEFAKPYSTMHIYSVMRELIDNHEKFLKEMPRDEIIDEKDAHLTSDNSGDKKSIFSKKEFTNLLDTIKNKLSSKYEDEIFDDETYIELSEEEIDEINKKA